MAYTTKYHFTHTDRFGISTLVNLKLRDYAGANTLLPYGGVNFEFGRSLSSAVVRGSAVNIGLWSLTQGQFSEFRDITDRRWQVEVIKGGSAYWYGWLTPEIFSEPFKSSAPYRIELSAVDGLGDLTNIDYPVAMDIATGSTRVPLKSVVYGCLNNIGLPLNCCFAAAIHPTGITGEIFDNCYYNNALFVDDKGIALKCADVLEQFLPLGITVKQWRGKWYVIRTADLVAPVHVTEYSTIGAYVSDYYLDLNETIDDTSTVGAVNIPLGQSGVMSQVPAYKEALVNVDFGLKSSMLENFDFTKDGASWSGFGTYDQFGKINDVCFAWLSAAAYLYPSGTPTGIIQSLTVEASTEPFVIELKAAPFGSQVTGVSPVQYTTIQLPINFRVKLIGATTTYYLDYNHGWVTTPTYIHLTGLESTVVGSDPNWHQIKITSVGLPVSGTLEIKLCQLEWVSLPSGAGAQGIAYTDILAYESGPTLLSTNELKAVNNSDYNFIPSEPQILINDAPVVSNSRLMYRNFVSNSAGVPTTTWTADGITGTYPLAELYLRHSVSLHRRPLKVINMNMRGALEWPGTMSDRDGNYYEVVSATLNDRECEWQVELREILHYLDLSPTITTPVSTTTPSSSTAPSTPGSTTLSPIVYGTSAVKTVIAFIADASPSVVSYNALWAPTFGQLPTVRIWIATGSDYQELPNRPKFTMSGGLIDTIVFDLGLPQTGFIILS